MSTAPPISDLIYDNVVETLSAIATVAGDNTDPTIVEESREGAGESRYRIVVVDNGEDCTAEGYESGHDEHTMNLDLVVTTTKPESDTLVTARSYNRRAYGDIRRALLTDRARGRNPSPRVDTQVTGWRPRSDAVDGIIVTVTITYLTRIGITNEPD